MSTENTTEFEMPMQIDFDLLKKQKTALLSLAGKLQTSDEATQDETDAVEGMICLIDAIQDHAVDALGMDKREIFNLSKDEDEDFYQAIAPDGSGH